MAGAHLLPLIHGNAPGTTAMDGATIGGSAGLVAGFAGGTALVLWQRGRWAGTALAWLGAGALLMVICLVWVAVALS